MQCANHFAIYGIYNDFDEKIISYIYGKNSKSDNQLKQVCRCLKEVFRNCRHVYKCLTGATRLLDTGVNIQVCRIYLHSPSGLCIATYRANHSCLCYMRIRTYNMYIATYVRMYIHTFCVSNFSFSNFFKSDCNCEQIKLAI